MDVKVGLALLEFTKIVLVVFVCSPLCKFNEVDQRSLFRAVFDETG